MVGEYGMSDLGLVSFGKQDEQIFLGREISQHRDYSEDTAIKIDQEVKKIIAEQYARAKEIIGGNSEAMVRLAESLLERETLNSVEIKKVVSGVPLDEDEGNPESGDDGASEESVSNPFKKPILPPITGNNPATA